MTAVGKLQHEGRRHLADMVCSDVTFALIDHVRRFKSAEFADLRPVAIAAAMRTLKRMNATQFSNFDIEVIADPFHPSDLSRCAIVYRGELFGDGRFEPDTQLELS